MYLSVLTIVRGREQHLSNQLRGLRCSERTPDQWVVVGMAEDPRVQTTDADFEILTDRVEGSGSSLPLAAARNRAARAAAGEVLVFLDVDCIPSPSLLGGLEAAVHDKPQLWMGSIGYLPKDAASGDWTFDQLDQLARRHPALPKLSAGQQLDRQRYEMFWSLCFAIRRTDFQRVGGFDESFCGYGAEDTDFAFSARKHQLPFGVIGHQAYHQHHAVCKPPLNHFQAILGNARRFRSKWGDWPMRSWLESFSDLGLIEFDAQRDHLSTIREPTSYEVAAATSMAPAGF